MSSVGKRTESFNGEYFISCIVIKKGLSRMIVEVLVRFNCPRCPLKLDGESILLGPLNILLTEIPSFR